MRHSDLIEAINLAQNFIKKARTQLSAHRSDLEKHNDWAAIGVYAASTKRASMDLTRALAAIRNRSR